MVAAMAAGTPVIAFANGSAPEVVEAGRSGLLVDGEDGMVEAVGQIDLIDPAECRASARERFSRDRIARRYDEVYRQIVMPSPGGATSAPVDENVYGSMTLRGSGFASGPAWL